MPSSPRDLWEIFVDATQTLHVKPKDGPTEVQAMQVFRERQRIFDKRLAREDEVSVSLEAHRNIGAFAGGLRATVASREPVHPPHAWLLFSMSDFQKVRDILCPIWPIC